MLGSHLSIAGSMVNALNEGEKLGLGCVQVFTKNQQQWKAKPLDAAMVKEWHAAVKRLKWNTGGPDDRGGIVSHASYLINLASPDAALWKKSVALMIDELQRCEELAIPYLVHHPGAFTTSTLAEGLGQIARAYKELFAATKGFRTISCLEGTVGAGSTIGGTFEELGELRARIVEATGEAGRVGFCLDTCHLHAAGYDLSTAKGAAEHFEAFDAACGLKHLKVWHVNDSKGKAGSHLDRHAHIGEGTIGGGTEGHPATGAKLARSGFQVVMNHKAFARVPKILETPKGTNESGTAFDTLNLARLEKLAAG